MRVRNTVYINTFKRNKAYSIRILKAFNLNLLCIMIYYCIFGDIKIVHFTSLFLPSMLLMSDLLWTECND